MYRYFLKKVTWIFPKYRARRRKDKFYTCLTFVLLLVLALLVVALVAVPQRSMARPSVTRQFVYSDDTQLQLPLTVLKSVDNKTHVNGFPKIMHHIFEKLDGKPRKKEWEDAHKSCMSMSSDFKHMMWNTSTIRQFLLKEYSWFVPTFDSYKYPVQRFDVARYFLLYHYGGVYIDMDIYCREQLSAVISSFPQNSRVILRATHPANDVATSLLFGHTKNTFFYFVTQRLQGAKHDSFLPYISIMFSTGPRFLSNSYYDYEHFSQFKSQLGRTRIDSSGIYILQQKIYKQLFDDMGSSSWHEWDAKIILFLYQLLPSFVTGLFV